MDHTTAHPLTLELGSTTKEFTGNTFMQNQYANNFRTTLRRAAIVKVDGMECKVFNHSKEIYYLQHITKQGYAVTTIVLAMNITKEGIKDQNGRYVTVEMYSKINF